MNSQTNMSTAWHRGTCLGKPWKRCGKLSHEGQRKCESASWAEEHESRQSEEMKTRSQPKPASEAHANSKSRQIALPEKCNVWADKDPGWWWGGGPFLGVVLLTCTWQLVLLRALAPWAAPKATQSYLTPLLVPKPWYLTSLCSVSLGTLAGCLALGGSRGQPLWGLTQAQL